MKARAAAQNITAEENRVIRDVRTAWLNATTAYDRLGLTQQLLDQAKLALDLAQSRYSLGLSSIVELSQAQLNLTSAQIASASAKYDYQSQTVLVALPDGRTALGDMLGNIHWPGSPSLSWNRDFPRLPFHRNATTRFDTSGPEQLSPRRLEDPCCRAALSSCWVSAGFCC